MSIANKIIAFKLNHPHFMTLSDEISFKYNNKNITARTYLKQALEPNFSDSQFKKHIQFMSFSYNALIQEYILQEKQSQL